MLPVSKASCIWVPRILVTSCWYGEPSSKAWYILPMSTGRGHVYCVYTGDQHGPWTRGPWTRVSFLTLVSTVRGHGPWTLVVCTKLKCCWLQGLDNAAAIRNQWSRVDCFLDTLYNFGPN